MVVRVLIYFLFVLSTVGVNGQYVSLHGKQFYDRDGSRFYPKIMNYSISPGYNSFPVNSMNDMWVGPWPQYGWEKWLENPDGLDQIRKDFIGIRALGFNAIRLITGLRRFNSPPCPDPTDPSRYCHPCNGIINGSLFTFEWFLSGYNANPNLNAKNNKCYAIVPPYDPQTNNNMAMFLQMLSDVINIADQENLRVILLTADGFDLFSGGFGQPNQQAVDDYKAFLEVLTSYFSTNTAILAYDLDNEPNYKDGDNNLWNRRKSEVCDFVTQLYDAIKPHNDPNHLITIGLGHAGTTQTWDPGVMKTDFVSLHIYPEPQWQYDYLINSQEVVMQHAIDRMMDQIYWASTYLERPWVLEETGFTSSDDQNSWDCGTFGDYNGLDLFLQQLLPVLRDCGPSGYAWWGFQDNFESQYNPPDCSLERPPGNVNLQHAGRTMAFIKSGNPDAAFGYGPLFKQPACSTLQSFPWTLSSPCSINPPQTVDLSSHYYDPYLNSQLNLGLSGKVTGTCTDDEGRVIKGALVAAANYLYEVTNFPDPTDYYNYWTYTFTDNNGDFALVPFNYNSQGINNIITQVRVTAPGHKTVETGTLQNVSVPSFLSFTLPGQSTNFATFLMLTVPQSEIRVEEAWSSVEFLGTNEVYGKLSVRARDRVVLNEGFVAQTGSDLFMEIEKVWPDCNDYSGFRLHHDLNIPNIQLSDDNLEIFMYIDNMHNQTEISLWPNPAASNTNLSMPVTEKAQGREVKIYTSDGILVQLQRVQGELNNIDLSLLSPGVYVVLLEGESLVWKSKLIVIK